MKHWYIFPLALAASACNDIDQDIPYYQTLTCTDLAREIGAWEARFEDAEEDAAIATLDELFGDREDRDLAAIDGLFADIEADEAADRIRVLYRLYVDRNCAPLR